MVCLRAEEYRPFTNKRRSSKIIIQISSCSINYYVKKIVANKRVQINISFYELFFSLDRIKSHNLRNMSRILQITITSIKNI